MIQLLASQICSKKLDELILNFYYYYYSMAVVEMKRENYMGAFIYYTTKNFIVNQY